jgi:hypothetical protein
MVQGTYIEASPTRSIEKQMAYSRSISNFNTDNSKRTKQRPETRSKRASEEMKVDIFETKPASAKRANQSLAHIRVRSEAELQLSKRQRPSKN